jgi:uncharacterized protein
MTEDFQTEIYKTAKVEVLEKRMKAYLVLKDSNPDQTPPLSVQSINTLLETSQIRSGINREIIQELIDGKITEDRILVAEGKDATPGEDARLEFNFPVDHSLKPQLREDGLIDFKEVEMVHSVEKDTVLIKKTPATYGAMGKDVYGNLIPALLGKDILVTVGQGAAKEIDDPNIIKATTDGIIFYDPQKRNIEVQKLFIVPESVDYSTGNIHVKSSVEIKGDVKAGFSVETPYNVDIRGGVEQASITCDGVLKVKDGINGDGKTVIKARDDIHAGYVSNQIIKAGASLYISFELRNSIIECEDEVTLIKNTGVIIGGKTTATNKVISPFIGNSYSVPTEIEVGVVMKFRDKYLKKEAEKVEIQRQFDELKKKISLVAEKPPSNAKTMLLATFKEIWAKCTADTARVAAELKEMETAYYNVPDPTVMILKTVFPKTTIKIKNKTFEVIEQINHVMFKMKDGEIIQSPIR